MGSGGIGFVISPGTVILAIIVLAAIVWLFMRR